MGREKGERSSAGGNRGGETDRLGRCCKEKRRRESGRGDGDGVARENLTGSIREGSVQGPFTRNNYEDFFRLRCMCKRC
eukprot:scaffold147281_cov27-Tisochrysis_lutea.AAC.2